MNKLVYWLAVLLMAAVALTGCSSGARETPAQKDAAAAAKAEKEPEEDLPVQNFTPAPAPEPPKPGQPQTEVSRTDISMAEGTVILYFDAVINQDKPLLDFLWADTAAAHSTKPVPTGGKAAIMEETKFVKSAMADGVANVWFEVKADLGENPGGAWKPGVNQRWVQVQKLPTGWKIKAVATTPVQ